METAEHIDALRRQGDLLADAAERAGLTTCNQPPYLLVTDCLPNDGGASLCPDVWFCRPLR